MELIDRLKECQSRIGKMCSEGRPPLMSIPADRERDDDLFISSAINDAIVLISNTAIRPAWMKAEQVPVEWEGCWAWKHTVWNNAIEQTVVPERFSREPRHCRGVSFMLNEPPTSPNDESALQPKPMPLNTEELDKLQFGRILHKRPTPADRSLSSEIARELQSLEA